MQTGSCDTIKVMCMFLDSGRKLSAYSFVCHMSRLLDPPGLIISISACISAVCFAITSLITVRIFDFGARLSVYLPDEKVPKTNKHKKNYVGQTKCKLNLCYILFCPLNVKIVFIMK